MNAMNMPGFTAEHSLYTSRGQFRTAASDSSYVSDAEIRPQLDCVEHNGQIVCSGGGGFGLGFTDVPSGGFPRFPFDHTRPQCRSRCYISGKKGAALKACLADC